MQKGPLLVPLNTFLLLVLIYLPHSCKMSGPYLVPVPDY